MILSNCCVMIISIPALEEDRFLVAESVFVFRGWFEVEKVFRVAGGGKCSTFFKLGNERSWCLFIMAAK